MKKLFITILCSALFSQVTSDYTFNTAESVSLAGANVSNVGGYWSLYSNPATLVDVTDSKLSVGSSSILGQSFLKQSSIGIIVNKFNKRLGLKYTSFSVNYSSKELLTENLIGLVSAVNLLKDKNSSLSLGLSANYYMVKYGPSAGPSGDGSDGLSNGDIIGSFGVDIGFLASLREKNRLGIFITNINSPSIGRGSSNQTLPRKIQLGLTTIPNDFMSISFVVEQLLGSNNPQYRTSLKYRINNIIYLNTGIQINPNRFGCGIVINKNKFNFSYAYLTHHVLPGTHQFNFGVNF
tara:strand:+ start:1354 stop:2235 length:882 start_codon:yes stop_codon:yes gene_type:complete